MTPDGFLSVLSIAVAVYALMTPVQKMKARLSFHMQGVLAVLFLAIVIYLQLFDTLQQPCILDDGWCHVLERDPPRTLNAQQLSFVFVIIWMGTAYCVHQFLRPWAAALPTIAKVVDTLLAERKHDDLLLFLRPHMHFLKLAVERRFVLQKIHDWLARFQPNDPRNIFGVPRRPGEREPSKSKLVQNVKSFLAWIRHVVPSERKSEAVALAILVKVARSDDLRLLISKYRPYFAFPLLSVSFREKFEFCDAYFRTLVSDRNSVFYQEMKVGLATSWTEGFELEPSNELQTFLFRNCQVAEDLNAWQPVGNYVEELIRGEHGPEYVEKLNGPKTAPAEDRDPTLTAIRFFDIMVRRAAFQGINYHMWLMYLTHFIEYVEQISPISAGGEDDEDDAEEFPTFGMYLIYEALDTLGDWVHLVRDLPEGSPHLQFNNRDRVSIPVFAAEALGRSLKLVLTSNRLPESFKSYMYRAVMSDIKNLHIQGVQGEARQMLIRRIVGGGATERSASYLRTLKSYLSSIDHIMRTDVSDFVDELNGSNSKRMLT